MKLINYLKSFLYFFISLVILLLIITIFYYFDIISNNTIKYLRIIIVILSTFISGIKIGQLSNNKGYIKGIILGSIISLIFLIINFITKNLKITNIIYYLIIIIFSTLGSIIGINKNHHA